MGLGLGFGQAAAVPGYTSVGSGGMPGDGIAGGGLRVNGSAPAPGGASALGIGVRMGSPSVEPGWG